MNATTAVLGIQNIQGAFNILAALQLTAFLWPQQAQFHGVKLYQHCPGTKKSKIRCDIRQPTLGLRGGLWPTLSHREKACVPAGGPLKDDCASNICSSDGACFDFIIVGAGSAGSVIANRLTEIEDATVLLIEAGGDPPIESVIPAFIPFLKKTSVDWNYKTEDDGYSQQFHKNGGVELTRGKMLGGSSSNNFMAYTRGNPRDFDNWAKMTGDESWKWEHVLPYFIKSERLVDPILLYSDAGAFHGTDGYLGTTRYYNDEVLKYFEAFKELGHDIVLDMNGDTPLGYTENMFNIADGVRQSTAQSFLRPIKNRLNLFVLKNTLVSKILFDDDKNAVGVEAILENNKTVSYKANNEVIVSAGAINTPQLLMLSGVGPENHLLNHNIKVLSDLPVGQDLQDHVMVIVTNTMGKSLPSKPVDPTKFPYPLIMGYATLNKSQDILDYQTISFVMNEPTVLLQFCSFYFSFLDEICNALYNSSVGREILFSLVFLVYPESRGKILLRSRDPKEQPVIYTGYYSNDEDLDKHAMYLQDFSKVQDTEFFSSAQAKLIIPAACGCGDLYSTHEYWKCYALCMMVSGYHYAASCPMGVVVDSRLNVFGVQRLRIADASVMPKITGANTNAATIMIAEKAADFIKEDNRLHAKE